VTSVDQIDSDAVFIDQAALNAAMTTVGSGVEVDLDSGHVITLLGVTTADVAYTDFI
jgi:hypothetical protein